MKHLLELSLTTVKRLNAKNMEHREKNMISDPEQHACSLSPHFAFLFFRNAVTADAFCELHATTDSLPPADLMSRTVTTR